MRAVVESPRLTELAGVNADRVSMTSWVLSSVLAGLAGVLISPTLSQVVGDLLHAARGRRDRGGGARGAVEHPGRVPRRLAARRDRAGRRRSYLPTNSILASEPAAGAAVRRAVPRARLLADAAQPARSSPTRSPVSTRHHPRSSRVERSDALTTMTRVFGVVVGARVVGYWLFFHANVVWVDPHAVRATILAIIFLSITVITGMAGEISLCQATFAAIGALRDRAARARSSACRCSSAMLLGAAHRGGRRRAARAARAAARRHLPLARDVRVRVLLRQRDGEVRRGSAAARHPDRGAPARLLGPIDFARATRRSSCCASSSSRS